MSDIKKIIVYSLITIFIKSWSMTYEILSKSQYQMNVIEKYICIKRKRSQSAKSIFYPHLNN